MQTADEPQLPTSTAEPTGVKDGALPRNPRAEKQTPPGQPILTDLPTWIAGVALLVSFLVMGVALRARRRTVTALVPMQPLRLTEADRAEAKLKIQRWLAEPASGPGGSA